MKNMIDKGGHLPLSCRRIVKRLSSALLLIALTANCLYASTQYAEATRFNLTLKNVALKQVFEEIEKQSEFSIIYKTNEVNLNEKTSVSVHNQPVDAVLKQVLKNQDLSYEIEDKHIILFKPEKRALPATQQQTQPVRGIVVDERGDPVIGASVQIKGTTQGTITDIEGRFTLPLNAPGSSQLQISFIGMETVELSASPGQNLTITMKDLTLMVDEVVVTGYGDFKKSTYTGAATVVSVDKLQDIPAVSVSQMLEAQVPGLSISGYSGQAGSRQTIRIRGVGSVNASSDPLIVLDGIPIISGNFSNDSNVSDQVGLDGLATINPGDIESITILKDATSTALYGARGANGVILITSKKGTEGKTSINLRANYTIRDFAVDYRPTMGGQERRELIHEGFMNYYIDDQGYSEAAARVEADKLTDIYAAIPAGGYSDWRDALFDKERQQQYDLSINGGSKSTKFSASLGYLHNNGMSLSSEFKRYSGRLNLNHIYDKFDFNMSMMYTYTDTRPIPEGGYYAGAMTPAIAGLTPSDAIYDEEGSYSMNHTRNGGYNPLHEDANTIAYNRIGRLIGGVGVGYQIIKPLKVSTTLDIESNNSRQFRFWNPESRDGASMNGIGQMYDVQYFRYQSITSLSYDQSFGKHHLNARATFEVSDYSYDYFYSRKENYGYWGNPALSNATKPVSVNQYENKDRLVSFVGLANYDYNSRYYLTASFRRDASSRLAPDARWGNFWSFSGSWRMSQEAFMQPMSHWLSDLKLKASYGVNGNLPSNNWYPWHSTFDASNQYGDYPALYESTLGNKNLSWEKNYNLNVGIDATLFNRINLEMNYYRRDSKDLLFRRPLFTATGFNIVWDNIGHMRNSGFEFELNSVNIQQKDFRWTSALNFYANKSKIIKLGVDGTPIIDSRLIRKEGEAWSSIYVIEYAGVDPETGEAQYYTNEEITDPQTGKITYSREITKNPGSAYRKVQKNAEPNLRGGLTNSFTYKFVDLSFHLSFSLGGWTVDNRMWDLQDDGYSPNTNKSIELRRRWKKPGDITDVPKYKAYYSYGGWYTSTRAIHSTDHLRMKNLTLGLRAPKQWTKTLGITSARLYFAGENLLTFTSLDLYDPELWGQQSISSPPLKSFSVGIDVTF